MRAGWRAHLRRCRTGRDSGHRTAPSRVTEDFSSAICTDRQLQVVETDTSRLSEREPERGRICHRPGGVPAPSSNTAAPERQLLRPPRLTIRQTRQAELRTTAAASHNLKIGHLMAVRSLTADREHTGEVLLREDLDVLCLSKTWLTNQISTDMLPISGYVICRRDRPTKKAGGGGAIVHRCSLRAEELRVTTGDSALDSAYQPLHSHHRRGLPAALWSNSISHRRPSPSTDPSTVTQPALCTFLLGDVNFDVLQPAKPGCHHMCST